MVVSHVEVVVGGGSLGVAFYLEFMGFIDHRSWEPYSAPRLGGIALGAALHRRL